MKAYVRAPYSEDCLQELRQMFDEVVYEPWTATGERYYEDEMLENLRRVQPDVLITELDRVTEKVLSGYDGLRVIGDCRGTPANLDVEACTRHGVPILCTPGNLGKNRTSRRYYGRKHKNKKEFPHKQPPLNKDFPTYIILTQQKQVFNNNDFWT